MAFGQDGYPIKPGFLERIGTAFGSPLGLVDYEDDPGGALEAINGWVSRQTMGRIARLLTPANVQPTTRLVLVNAVYLKAAWLAPFETKATAPGTFHLLDGSTTQTAGFDPVDINAVHGKAICATGRHSTVPATALPSVKAARGFWIVTLTLMVALFALIAGETSLT
jgi:hypothetical protein